MKKLLLLTIMTVASAIAGAQIIHVPNDYSTIQEGIDAAQFFGDTVLVAEGTYYENIDFTGKFITVASHFIMDGDTNHINNTIIDGSQPANPGYGSVVYFRNNEDTTSVLCGFTITGGSGTWFPSDNIRTGGGICIENAGAKILHNRIVDNDVQTSEMASGGGITVGDATNNFNYVVIRHNFISGNNVEGTYFAEGGGISLYSHGIVEQNIITNNEISSETIGPIGGGIRSFGVGESRVFACNNNVISDNSAYSGSYTAYGGAGGMQVVNCYGRVGNNTIQNNEITGVVDGGGGGGLHFRLCDNSMILDGNYIIDNNAGVGGYGGGVALWSSNITMTNNIIAYNQAGRGSGIDIHQNLDGVLQVVNNTIAYNELAPEGRALHIWDAEAVILNSILWNDGDEIFVDGGDVEVAYSDVCGGYAGISIIDEDPEFIDEAFHIPVESSCKDMGFDQLTMLGILVIAPDHDFEGTPRPMDGGFDIGADEYPIGTGINEFAESYFNMNIFPNPTQRLVKLRYEVDDAQSVSLSIFNINGVEVFSKYFGYNIPGEYNQELDLLVLPPGIYLLRLQAGDVVETAKIIIQK